MLEQAGVAEPEQVYLSWDTRIRLLTNPSVWGGVAAAFGIACLLFTILMVAISRRPEALLLGIGLFIGFMALYVVIAVFIDLFGGFKASFAITTLGVRSASGKGAKGAADAAFWSGVLLGSASAAGAGLLARSEQQVFIPYSEVTALKMRPARLYIVVKGGLLDKPIGLYCTPENYAETARILRQMCPGARLG